MAHPAVGDPKDGERNEPGLAGVVEDDSEEQAGSDGRARVAEPFGQGESHGPDDGAKKSARYAVDNVAGERWWGFSECKMLEKPQTDEDSDDLAEDKSARPPAPTHPVDKGDEQKTDSPATTA